MPRKALSPERAVSNRSKPIGLTWDELKALIDEKDGYLKLDVKLGRDSCKLVIRVKHAIYPESWPLSVLWHGPCIEVIDNHVSPFKDKDGNSRTGWHRDFKESGMTVRKVVLDNFDPRTPEEFILQGLKLMKFTLKEQAARR